MSIDKFNQEVQNRRWSHGDTNDNLLFSDSAIILLGKFEWDEDLVTDATLTLYNVDSEDNYEICAVTNCEADGEYGDPYILIHLTQDGISLKSEITVSSRELGSLRLRKGDRAHFLFKVYDSCSQDFSCGFNGIKPFSKDGSIIICI